MDSVNIVNSCSETLAYSENLNRPAIDIAIHLWLATTGITGRPHVINTIATYEHEVDEVIKRAISERHFISAMVINHLTQINSNLQQIL